MLARLTRLTEAHPPEELADNTSKVHRELVALIRGLAERS
jgi:hypothetical protein